MKCYLPVSGTLLAVLWSAGFCAVTGVAVWLLVSVFWGLVAGFGLFALLAALCALHRIGYCIEVRDYELILTRGFFLTSVQKFPLRFVTGTSRITTPLSRLLGVGVLTISTSGRMAALVGLSLRDIAALRSFLIEREGGL